MTASQETLNGWRLKAGITMFALSIVLPVAGVPLVAVLGMSRTVTASVSGGLLVTAEILGIAAIAVMGKKGYAAIKQRILGWLKQYGPPNRVGALRYKVGLVMFSVPVVFGWISIYTAEWIPAFGTHPVYFAVVGDLMLLASLFVLGGDFWDKMRSLFVHDAVADFSRLKPIA